MRSKPYARTTAFRGGFTGGEVRAKRDGISQFAEPFERGFFDIGFEEGHDFSALVLRMRKPTAKMAGKL